MSTETEWFRDYVNVKRLGGWLVESKAFDADDLQHYYEAPWKWTAEWNEMLAEDATT